MGGTPWGRLALPIFCLLAFACLGEAYKLRWECTVCERAWPIIQRWGLHAADGACAPQNAYSTDVNEHLCLFFEDGRCKRYLGQETGDGWTGFLPNPFDWAFKVFTPGKQTYVHGYPARVRVPASVIPDRWCPEVVSDMRQSPNLHQLLGHGCSLNHGPYRWYERSCSARSACRCLINRRDNQPFCTDGTDPTTVCKAPGNPANFPAMSSPIGHNGLPRVSRRGSSRRHDHGGGRHEPVVLNWPKGKPYPKPPKGQPDPFDWSSESWRKRPPPTIAGGRGGHFTVQVKALAENKKMAKKDMIKLHIKAADQFNPDTQPKCGPLMPDCSPPAPIMSYTSGTEVPP